MAFGRLPILAFVLFLSACDVRPKPPPPSPKLAHPLPPRSSPTLIELEKHGLSLKVPPCWTVTEGSSKSSIEGILLEFKCGTELMGQLHWMMGGVAPEILSDSVIKNISAKCRNVDVLKRQPFPGDGIRVDLRAGNNVPDTLRWSIVHFFHRGRVIDFMLWTQPGNWYLHSQEVEDLLKNVTLVQPEDLPVATGAFHSKKHGYDLALPPGWNLVEVDPPEGETIARLWTGRGLPFGMILRLNARSSASEYLDKYLEGLALQKRLAEPAHRAGISEDVSAELVTDLAAKYRHSVRVLQNNQQILHCELWAPLEAAPEVHATIARITGSLKLR